MKKTVLVVDDSKVVVHLLTAIINDTDDLTVCGSIENGSKVEAAVEKLKPDVISLDLELPGLDGISVAERLRESHPHLPVVMVSGRIAPASPEALAARGAGVVSYLVKPVDAADPVALRALQVHLPLKLRAAIQAKTKEGSTSDTKRLMTAAMPSPRPTQVKVRTFGERFEALVIGVSTGGPDALAEVIPKLSGHLPVPVFLVQHMPASFITAFADRLDELSELSVHQADEGAAPQAGQVYIAPGDQHMVLEPGADVRIRLQQTPPENGCRPAVDPLFRTAAEVYGDACLALILTGMGHDGLAGSRALQGKGATIIAQDEISSVVWGMPGAVVGAGLASEILPLDEIAPRLSLLLNRGAARA